MHGIAFVFQDLSVNLYSKNIIYALFTNVFMDARTINSVKWTFYRDNVFGVIHILFVPFVYDIQPLVTTFFWEVKIEKYSF